MAKRKTAAGAKRQPTLEDWEVSIIKAMILDGRFKHDQEILAHFTRPGRTVNSGRIVEIRGALADPPHKPASRKFLPQPPASAEELEAFLATWPALDPRTGLHIQSDELLIKCREAMMAAVQIFNNPLCQFKSELFITTACISWTYFFHYYYRREGVRYWHVDKTGQPKKTPHGATRHFGLEECLDASECPLDDVAKRNLRYLLAIRHEIEHQMTTRIDQSITAKLQACCLNLNTYLKQIFGDRCGLERELSLSLQFSSIDLEQRRGLHGKGLPPLIESVNKVLEGTLSDDEYNDPRYAYRVALIPKTVSKRGQADDVIEFVKADSPEADEISRILLKDVEPRKWLPGQVVDEMKRRGYPKFRIREHTQLWQDLDAKKAGKGYGIKIAKTWYWYDRWVKEVEKHCQENAALYGVKPAKEPEPA